MRLTKKEKDQHLQFAKSLNGLVWELLGKSKLSKDNIELMIHAAHGSCFHWLKVGTNVNHQRALWLLSRVYGVAGESSQSLKYASQCLEMTLKNSKEMKDFDVAYAYEAQARASFINKRAGEGKRFLVLAREAGQKIKNPEDKKLFFSDLKFGGLGK